MQHQLLITGEYITPFLSTLQQKSKADGEIITRDSATALTSWHTPISAAKCTPRLPLRTARGGAAVAAPRLRALNFLLVRSKACVTHSYCNVSDATGLQADLRYLSIAL
ncbi:hypothetical protein CHARACLAT_002614 [Characodon lateralis]|uniref:Uncharacterized protein n=1 Tax=Characodon lateralis TaxID=208331 RepID=A0ABU7D476_9TELE|nr:hypothetical protein [Characodon lateralis]